MRPVLKGKRRFTHLFQHGRRYSHQGISLICCRATEPGTTYYAVCVPRKAGTAVIRNRLKRIVHESIRSYVPFLKRGYYIAIFPGNSFNQLSATLRKETLSSLLKKAGLLNHKET